MIGISKSFYLLAFTSLEPLLPFTETHLTNNTASTFCFSPTVQFVHVWLWVHTHAKSSSVSLTLWSDQSGLPGAYTLLCCADLHATYCTVHTIHKLLSTGDCFLIITQCDPYYWLWTLLSLKKFYISAWPLHKAFYRVLVLVQILYCVHTTASDKVTDHHLFLTTIGSALNGILLNQ